MSLRVISSNVNGLAQNIKRKKYFTYLKENKIDIAFIQETHATKKAKKIWVNEFNGKIVFSNGESNAKGVAIIFGNNLDMKIISTTRDTEGRYLFVEIMYHQVKVGLINLYAPNNDDPTFFQKIFERVNDMDVDHIIVGGDFNKVLDGKVDRKSKTKQNCTASAKLINEFLEENNFVDIWRIGHPNTSQFTWHKRNPIVFSRLDYFLIPGPDIANVVTCEIWSNTISDHEFVFMEMVLEKQARGRGYWKFNASLLYDKGYIDGVNIMLDETLLEVDATDMDDSDKWEVIKIKITEYTQWFSKNKAHEKNQRIKTLKNKLSNLKKKLGIINVRSSSAIRIIQKTNDKIDIIKLELDKFETEKAQGALLRSKACWMQEAGQNSKYFMRLEKSKAKSKTMSAVGLENGNISRKPMDILEAQRSFYRSCTQLMERSISQ